MIGRAQTEGNSYGDGNRRRDATDESSARGAEGELYHRDARKPRGTHRPHRPRDRVAGRQCRRIRYGGERGFRASQPRTDADDRNPPIGKRLKAPEEAYGPLIEGP